MFSHFSINVTEFFREPKQMKIFKDEIVPYLKTFPYLKIWCAGCSIGMESYSLSILLEECGITNKYQIYATDFNNKVLEHAKTGLYDIPNFEEASTTYKMSGGEYNLIDYFIKKGKFYQIKKRLKEKILYFNHNLVTDSIINNFQLIICKNVVIYFNKDLKDTILKNFNESLVPHGFMVLGNSEFLPTEFTNSMKLYNEKSKVYQKRC
jgi:chemotaxis protein methyltransferase CheR